MKKLIVLFLVAIMAFSIVSCGKSEADNTADDNEKESVTTKEEAKNPNSLAKVIRLSLDRYKGKFSFYWEGDHKGQMTGQQLTGVSRFLYRTKKATVYQEISVAMILADGTGADIDEGNELIHLIVVFEKGHKLTDNEKKILKEYDIDYMFERK